MVVSTATPGASWFRVAAPPLIRKFVTARDRGSATVEVWGTGSASGEFLFVDDCAHAIVLAAEKAAIDAILASQNVALAAEAHGLGICYMGSTLANADQVGEILELPPGVFPVVGFVLGWPDEDPAPRDRLPLDGLVHRETYRDHTDAEISEIYRDRDRAGWDRYMSIPRLRELVEDNDVQNLAQIYTVVKYTREGHARYTETILDYLATQGFLSSYG